MCCGPWCGRPSPEPAAASLYHGAWVKEGSHEDIKELVVIASCPGDFHLYFTQQEYEHAETAARTAAGLKPGDKLVDTTWFKNFVDALDVAGRTPLADVTTSEFEKGAERQYRRSLLPLGVAATHAAAEARDARQVADKLARKAALLKTVEAEEKAESAQAASKLSATRAAAAKVAEAGPDGDRAWEAEEVRVARAAKPSVRGIHSKLQDIARLSQGYVIFSPIQFLNDDVRRGEKYTGHQPAVDVKAQAIAKDHYCTDPATCPMCAKIDTMKTRGDPRSLKLEADPDYELHSLWQAVVSAMNKYSVDSIKVVSVYGGGPGAKGEREKLHNLGLTNNTLKSAKQRTQGCFRCLLCCATCGGYECARCCPGCKSATYMGEAVVLRFLLCTDPRDVEVQYITVDFNDLVDYLQPGSARSRYDSLDAYLRRNSKRGGRTDGLQELQEEFNAYGKAGCCSSFFCGANYNAVAAEPTPPPAQEMGRGSPSVGAAGAEAGAAGAQEADLRAATLFPGEEAQRGVSVSKQSSGWRREEVEVVEL